MNLPIGANRQRSSCYVYKAADTAGIKSVFTAAQAQRLSIIPRGAGHSYTDAALNTVGWSSISAPCTASSPGTRRKASCASNRESPYRKWYRRPGKMAGGRLVAIHTGGHHRRLRRHERQWPECLEIWPFWRNHPCAGCALPTGEARTLLRDRDAKRRAIPCSHREYGAAGRCHVDHLPIATYSFRGMSPSGSVLLLRWTVSSPCSLRRNRRVISWRPGWMGLPGETELGRGILTSAAFVDSGDTASSPFPASGAFGRLETPLMRLLRSCWPACAVARRSCCQPHQLWVGAH